MEIYVKSTGKKVENKPSNKSFNLIAVLHFLVHKFQRKKTFAQMKEKGNFQINTSNGANFSDKQPKKVAFANEMTAW